MSVGRCQICGRKKCLSKSGMIAHHCVGGPACPGTGYLPIEQDDARLVEYAAQVGAAYRNAREAVERLEEARANRIDRRLIVRRAILAGLALKIGRRLKRHRDWPERYQRSVARQMERQGYAWADPPPAYLVECQKSADPTGEGDARVPAALT